MAPPSVEPSPPYAEANRGAQAILRQWANWFATRPAGMKAGAGWLREFAVAGAAGTVLGVLGPFGSFDNGPLPGRLAYWIGAVLVGTAVLGAARRTAQWAALRWQMPFWLVYAAATVLAAVPLAAMSHAAATTLWSGPIRQVPALTWYAETLLISAILPLLYGLADLGAPVAHAPPPGTTPPASFLARLPLHLGRDLVALQMEDHYVRAHTRLGSALILVPLHQAIGELTRVPGLRIHRSWWVARDAVVGSVQDGRNVRLRLSNGLLAPVARTSVAEARAAGLLAPRVDA